MTKGYKTILACFASAVLLIGCDVGENTTQEKQDKRLSDSELLKLQDIKAVKDGTQFLFGFDLRSSPQEDARQYLPFLNYLEQKTGYRFKLRFTPRDGKIVDDLGKGIIQFAAIGAVSYIQAADKYNVKPLVRGLNIENKAEYQSMIIVRSNSPIRKLDDLRGKRLAFGSRTSTQGHLIPRIELSKNNIKLSQLQSYEYMGSHQKCADAVISGRFDACGLQDTMAKDLQRQHKVRILHRSGYFPSSGIVVNKDVAEEVIVKVRQAMLDFQPKGKDEPKLYNWNKTEMPNGFVAADNNDYVSLRKWLTRLGLNNKQKASVKLSK